MKKMFQWIDNNKNKDSSLILLLKFLYSISNGWVYTLINITFPIFLSPLLESDKKMFTIIFIAFLILNSWFLIVNAYKSRQYTKERNVKFISEEINAAMTTLDNYINNEYIDNGIFEFASDLVSASIYNSLKGITGCEIRVSVIQQFVEVNLQNNCVMISRRSKTRQKCQKSQKRVKYEKNKDYYYQKILKDNKDNMIILNAEQIDRHFIYKNKDRKSQIQQYLGIPDKNSTNEIVFILQLDAMKENAFGSDRNEINLFYDDYIYPYICFLRHAYNIEKNLKKKEGGKNE